MFMWKIVFMATQFQLWLAEMHFLTELTDDITYMYLRQNKVVRNP